MSVASATFAANNGVGAFDWDLTARGMRGDVDGYVAEYHPAAAAYQAWFGTLDPGLRDAVTAHWGDPPGETTHWTAAMMAKAVGISCISSYFV